jgi:hypothetical protein
MNSITPLRNPEDNITNPLDSLEDVLEASGYSYDRIGADRLHFGCNGKQANYTVMLERHPDNDIIKLTLIMVDTKNIDRDKLDRIVLQVNESAWNGFFMIDGVGNSIFKSFIQCDELSSDVSLFLIEEAIDKSMKEADRFYIMLAINHTKDKSDTLFPVSDNDVDNLDLLFSDIKGNA